MAKLTRVTGKVFGGSAPLDEIGQFGSALAGTPTNTQDVSEIQALSAYSQGWGSAIVTSRNFPPIEEVTGVLKTISYQNCYLLQEGIPAYDANTEYSDTSLVKTVSGTQLKIYVSLTDNNIGNPLTDTTHWAQAVISGTRNIGEIIQSAIPLTDASLHLLDGSLISGSGAYAEFVTYIASIYNSSLNYFCTEDEWQSYVNTYGSCGKFVYNSTNNTVRLPKVSNILEGTTDITALGDLVEAGLPNITGTFSGSGEGSSYATGAFYSAGAGAYVYNQNSDRDNQYGLDASRSSSIYGNSITVQPQTIKVLYYIVIATSTKIDIEVDIDEIATDLNSKADVDLGNTTPTQAFINNSIDWVMPDWSKIVSKVVGTTYTATQRGWIQAHAWTTQNGIHIKINGYDVAFCEAQGTNDTGGFACLVPVGVGDTYVLKQDGTTVVSYNFIPCKGEA